MWQPVRSSSLAFGTTPNEGDALAHLQRLMGSRSFREETEFSDSLNERGLSSSTYLIAVRQQVYYAVAEQVHQDRPEPVTTPKCEIVYSKLDNLSGWKIGQNHHPPQDRLARGWHAEPCAE